jgi:lipoprotein-anchoring transpeptidase ErfK/SrfK
MAEIPLQDVDSIRYPRRRPWLVLTVVTVVCGVVLWLVLRPAPPPREDSPFEEEASPVSEPVAAAPAATAAVVPARAPSTAPAAVRTPSAPPPAAVAASMAEGARLEALHPQQPDALAQAHAVYQKLLSSSLDAATRAEVEKRLGRIGVELVTTPVPWPGVKIDYVVQKGDSIDRIARKFGTTKELIGRSNQITTPDRIKVGDRMRILNKKFSIEVSKTRNEQLILLDGAFFKRYQVGTGKFGKTPVGTFAVSDRIKEPVWWKPDGKEVPFGHPENILGTRWMAIKAKGDTPDARGYGIHGTWADDSIGKAESAGCIRMHNKDVEELFELIPLGTSVTISE